MVKAVRIHKTGGPDVLTFEDVPLAPPAAGQVRVRHGAIGLNFIDTYFRSGLYSVAQLPVVLGNEGAGTVVEIGPGVSDVVVGDRVAYVSSLGAYAEERIIDANLLVKVPDGVSDELAAAMMLKGMTAEYLVRRTFRVEPGHHVLVHAAAGGTGSLVCQWAKHLGATVIGTVGSQSKVALARDSGCDHVILSSRDDVAAEVRRLTGAAGCEVVYDGVGKSTFMTSLDCVRKFGVVASFGSASGNVEAFNLGILAGKGSPYVTRPTLFNYIGDRATLLDMARALFDVVASGAVRVTINHRFALAETAKAHEELEGRRTTGATVLLP